MEINQNFKLYYILPAAVLVIIIAVALLLPKKSTTPTITPTPTVQMPTAIPTYSLPVSSSASSRSLGRNVTPTLIPVAYTGAEIHQDIPQSEADLAIQKKQLRKKTPLTQPSFTITFDYANDLFVVTLSEPKETSKTQFNQWLQSNYPSIPVDRFSFK